MRHRSRAFGTIAVLTLLAVAACAEQPDTASLADFEAAVADDADCQELFDIRNALTGPEHEEASNRLGQVGCFSITSTRQTTTTLDPNVEPNPQCVTDFAAAEQASFDDADAAIAVTLTSCGTYSQWLAALRRHPGSFGMTGDTPDMGPVEVQIACADESGTHAQTPVCRDAIAAGIITPAQITP